MYMTWIGSLLYCRSCSPRITRWYDGLKKRKKSGGWSKCWKTYCVVTALKWLTSHRSEQQWQPSTGWSVNLHKSGIQCYPAIKKTHIFNKLLHFNLKWNKLLWIVTVAKPHCLWVVNNWNYLKRNLPRPGARHSIFPIHNLVVSTHLGLDSRHSTAWDPVT